MQPRDNKRSGTGLGLSVLAARVGGLLERRTRGVLMNLPDDLWTKVNIEFQRDAEDGVQGAGVNVRGSHGWCWPDGRRMPLRLVGVDNYSTHKLPRSSVGSPLGHATISMSLPPTPPLAQPGRDLFNIITQKAITGRHRHGLRS